MDEGFIRYRFSDKNIRCIYTMKERGEWVFCNKETVMLSNYKYIAGCLELDVSQFVRPVQSGGENVVTVSSEHAGTGVVKTPVFEDADAMITDEPGLALCMIQSDCVPVYIFDPVKRAVGLVHSGRTGTADNIVSKTVRCMKDMYNSNPGDMEIIIGPHICEKCYRVDRRTAENFATSLSGLPENMLIEYKDGAYYINLKAAILQQLEEAGADKEKIQISDRCTFEDERLFSYRRGDGTMSGLSLIALGPVD